MKRALSVLLVLVFSWAPMPGACAEPLPSASSAPFSIRVLIAEKRTHVSVTIKGNYRVRALPSGKILKTGNKLISERVAPVAGGLMLGRQAWQTQALLFEPAEERDLYLDKTRLRGSFAVHAGPGGTMYVVNTLDIEQYLYGVLHHEVAPWWPMEALKAQAIAARTYAVYQASVSRSQPYDVKSSTSSQVYGGSTTERYRTKKAVDRTAGQILTYDKQIFPAYFHATCAGTTAAAKELWNIDLPPIAGGAKCNYCRISPHYYWQAKVPLSTVEKQFNEHQRPIGQILRIEAVSRTPSGRVGSLKVTGTRSEAIVAAKDFRVWVGGDLMKSTDFSVVVREDVAEFRGKGWGHGVGLCQWGSLGQALLGRSHREIIQFYYPGSRIQDLTQK